MDITSISRENLAEIDKFWDWMERTNRAKIVKFNASGLQLRSLFDEDVSEYWKTGLIPTMSRYIELHRNVSDEKKRFFVEESYPRHWTMSYDPEMYNCYRMYKLLWLARDIKSKDFQEAPVQIFKKGNGYNCHPGSDKRHIITNLQPMKSVRCFYIWYPELDPSPWHWTISYDFVNSKQEFVDMFPRADHNTFAFEHGSCTWKFEGEWSTTTGHFNPFGNGAAQVYKKNGAIQNDKFENTLEHLSYRDAIHRMGMFENKHWANDIYFEGDDIFHLGEFRFTKINDLWIPDMYNNFPTSLADEDWKYNRDSAIFFQNTRSNISKYRDDK